MYFEEKAAAAAVVLVAAGAVFGVGNAIAYNTTTGTETCTVQSKDRAGNSNGGSDMRVYTYDCGVLSVADSIFDGRFNSADIYQHLTPEKRYEFATRGFRFPLFSQFPNIISAKEVTK